MYSCKVRRMSIPCQVRWVVLCMSFSTLKSVESYFATFFFLSFTRLDLPFQKPATFQVNMFPIASMYGIFTYIWLIFMINVGKYTIHGSYGFDVYQTLWKYPSLQMLGLFPEFQEGIGSSATAHSQPTVCCLIVQRSKSRIGGLLQDSGKLKDNEVS